MYTWNQLGINEVTNLYLYGSVSKPVNLRSESLIRDTLPLAVEMDAVSFMSSGPGRFANASQFKLVQAFMGGGAFVFPANGARQVFTLDQAVARFGGGNPEIKNKPQNLSILQSNYQDGSDDLLMRAYVYQTSGYTIEKNAQFIIEADGTRRIENFAILPFNDDFDFESSSPASKAANAYLKPRIDPTGIGRKFLINFTNTTKDALTRTTYTEQNLQTDRQRYQQTYSVTGSARVIAALQDYADNLWAAGNTKILDSDGRAVVHGTSKADTMDVGSVVNLAAYAPLKTAMQQNGIAYIAGKGIDTINAGITNDYLDGGVGDDRLNGGAGNDTYV